MTNKSPWTLVVYHADWCGHCVTFIEGGEWEQLKKRKNRGFRIAKMESKHKKFPSHIKSYPTVELHCNNKRIATYGSGDRSPESLINWVTQEKKKHKCKKTRTRRKRGRRRKMRHRRTRHKRKRGGEYDNDPPLTGPPKPVNQQANSDHVSSWHPSPDERPPLSAWEERRMENMRRGSAAYNRNKFKRIGGRRRRRTRRRKRRRSRRGSGKRPKQKDMLKQARDWEKKKEKATMKAKDRLETYQRMRGTSLARGQGGIGRNWGGAAAAARSTDMTAAMAALSVAGPPKQGEQRRTRRRHRRN